MRARLLTILYTLFLYSFAARYGSFVCTCRNRQHKSITSISNPALRSYPLQKHSSVRKGRQDRRQWWRRRESQTLSTSPPRGKRVRAFYRNEIGFILLSLCFFSLALTTTQRSQLRSGRPRAYRKLTLQIVLCHYTFFNLYELSPLPVFFFFFCVPALIKQWWFIYKCNFATRRTIEKRKEKKGMALMRSSRVETRRIRVPLCTK